jgi:hypothetical protein
MKLVSINGSDVSGFDVDKVTKIMKDVESTERILIFEKPKGKNDPSPVNIPPPTPASPVKKESISESKKIETPPPKPPKKKGGCSVQ